MEMEAKGKAKLMIRVRGYKSEVKAWKGQLVSPRLWWHAAMWRNGLFVRSGVDSQSQIHRTCVPRRETSSTRSMSQRFIAGHIIGAR